MARQIEGVSRIVAVASGKGGVGKTTISVNLALALAANGAKVGLFDADVYGPNVPLMLGVRRTGPSNAFVAVARRETAPYIDPLERYGLKIMSFGFLVDEKDVVLADQQLIALSVKQTILDVKWGVLDYLVIDLPPGSGEPQQTLLKDLKIDGAVVVTTPQDLSLLDAGRSLGLFRKAGVPILGVVENMSYLRCPHCGEEVEVFHRSERRWLIEDQTLNLLGRIPMDIQISRGIDSGHPLVTASPDAAESAVFRDIATKVAQALA